MRILLLLFILILILQGSLLSSPIIEDEYDLYDLLLTGEISYSQYLMVLSLLRRGVDINTDEIMELRKIPGLSEIELLRIKEARKIEELKSLIDEETYLRILPFVRGFLQGQGFYGNLRVKIHERLYDSKEAEYYGQLRLYYGRNTEAYIAIKKKEEEFETSSQYLRLKDLGFIKEMMIGDYKAYFGEGLTLYTTLNGAILKLRILRLDQAFIYSYPPSKERLIGTNSDLSFGTDGKIGMTLLTYKDRLVYGAHVRIPIRDIKVFSECSLIGKSTGLIAGIDLDLRPIGTLVSYRRYDKGFNNPYSNGFCGDDTKDEEGIYLELKALVGKNWKVIGFFNGWTHLSNLTSDSKKGIRISYGSKKIGLQLLREYSDEDIDTPHGRRTKTSFEAIFPFLKTKASIYLRSTEIGSFNDKEVNAYLRLRLEYRLSSSLAIESGLKLNANDLYHHIHSYRSYYLQWKDKLNNYLSFVSRYTNTTYNYSHEPPNPENEFDFKFDLSW